MGCCIAYQEDDNAGVQIIGDIAWLFKKIASVFTKKKLEPVMQTPMSSEQATS